MLVTVCRRRELSYGHWRSCNLGEGIVAFADRDDVVRSVAMPIASANGAIRSGGAHNDLLQYHLQRIGWMGTSAVPKVVFDHGVDQTMGSGLCLILQEDR